MYPMHALAVLAVCLVAASKASMKRCRRQLVTMDRRYGNVVLSYVMSVAFESHCRWMQWHSYHWWCAHVSLRNTYIGHSAKCTRIHVHVTKVHVLSQAGYHLQAIATCYTAHVKQLKHVICTTAEDRVTTGGHFCVGDCGGRDWERKRSGCTQRYCRAGRCSGGHCTWHYPAASPGESHAQQLGWGQAEDGDW